MADAEKHTTTVSTKGQVIAPKALRDRLLWPAGTRLEAELTGDGVLFKAAPLFPPTRSEDVFGMLQHHGPPVTLAEMDAGIMAEVRRRHARNRY